MTRLNLRAMASGAIAVSVAALAAGAALADDSLTILDWSGYDADNLHPAYIEKYGEAPAYSIFAEEAEAFDKIRAGYRADLGHPCIQSVPKWREGGILQPLDPSMIEGWNDFVPGMDRMRDLTMTEDGEAWFMPWDWGNSQLVYNTDRIDEADVQSVRAFADPQFRGRVSITDGAMDAYALASLAIGVKDWATMTDEQFEEASAFLREVHKNVRFYWLDGTDIAQALASGEVDLTWAWNETIEQAREAGMPVVGKKDTDEGISTWVCGLVRFKDAPGSEERAYDYLNSLNDPRVAQFMVGDWGYAVANATAMAGVDPGVLAAKGYDDADRVLEKSFFQSPMPSELNQRMTAEFEKIKAGY